MRREQPIRNAIVKSIYEVGIKAIEGKDEKYRTWAIVDEEALDELPPFYMQI